MSETIRVKVVFLGRAWEIVGKHLVSLELPENSTLLDLVRTIGERYSMRFYKRFVDGHYVYTALVNGKPVINPDYVLRDGDRVVFITPEMGG